MICDYTTKMSSNLKDAWLLGCGECVLCKNPEPPPDESVQCSNCKRQYHMFCPSLAPGTAHCNKTFLKNFHAQTLKNSFFSWTCEPCSINKDTAAKSDLKHQVEKLAAQMETQQVQIETMATNVEQLVKTIPTVNPLIQPSGSTQGNP